MEMRTTESVAATPVEVNLERPRIGNLKRKFVPMALLLELLTDTIMNRSLGLNSGQRLRCFISWKRVASTRRALAVMLHHLRPPIARNRRRAARRKKKRKLLLLTLIL